MDNASYRLMLHKKILSRKTKKADVIVWLKRKNIDHNPAESVSELFCIVYKCRSRYKIYELDSIANEMGH